MTSKKFISGYNWFCHNLNETLVWHGLYNGFIKYKRVGYFYKDSLKGFHLDFIKR